MNVHRSTNQKSAKTVAIARTPTARTTALVHWGSLAVTAREPALLLAQTKTHAKTASTVRMISEDARATAAPDTLAFAARRS